MTHNFGKANIGEKDINAGLARSIYKLDYLSFFNSSLGRLN